MLKIIFLIAILTCSVSLLVESILDIKKVERFMDAVVLALQITVGIIGLASGFLLTLQIYELQF